MWRASRREFLRAGTALAAGLGLAADGTPSGAAPSHSSRKDVEVINPQGRVPLSLFIDDSTCLVNTAHFFMPQLAEAWPENKNFRKPWKTWPREIPDAFLREFAQWCGEHGVKGKFTIIPYPGCVGWLDRELPGWSRQELRASLKLVREWIAPRWDITPEMITHTRVIDIRAGRPMDEVSSATMENSYPQTAKTADELAAYIAYALRILKNCDLECSGITTPGGFGNAAKSELSLAVQQAVRDVFAAEVPYYFKYVVEGDGSTAPKLEHVHEAGEQVKLTVNVPAGTGDWFGNWNGDSPCQGHRYANQDATAGRLVDLIERGGPAVMLFHWPGMYCNGTRRGFEEFKKVVTALESRFRDRTLWMKSSEIACYFAAKELTRIERNGSELTLCAALACPGFALRRRRAGSRAAHRPQRRDGAAPPGCPAARSGPGDVAPGERRRGGMLRPAQGQGHANAGRRKMKRRCRLLRQGMVVTPQGCVAIVGDGEHLRDKAIPCIPASRAAASEVSNEGERE